MKRSFLLKKIFLAIVIPLSIFLFFFLGVRILTLLHDRQNSVVETSVKDKQEYKVFYTPDGYVPGTLEVPIGSTVSFTNTTDAPMWTASDPHPVHSDFSAFDARRGYKKNETYSFRFRGVGTFGFHNHEKSLHRGVIRVFDPKNSSPNIDKTKESQRVTRDKLMALLEEDDPNSIFTLIDTIEANNTISRDCHDMAHDLGHKSYELYGFSTAMTFSNPEHSAHTSVDDICAGGYMHGILEELFLHQPKLKENPEPICSSIPDLNKDSCFHGVGHGLMFVNKRNAQTSLDICRRIDKNYLGRCFEGVWMELFWGNTDHAGANTLGWSLDKPLQPCIEANGDEKPACFLYAHLGYLRTHIRDFTGVVSLCTQSGLNNSDTNFCLRGLGITMMKHFTSHHLEESEKLVAGLDAEKRYAYYTGVVGYARLSGMSDEALYTFCSSLKKDTDPCTAVLKNVPR